MVGCGQFFVNETKGLKVVTHGDDFLSSGPKSSVEWLDGFKVDPKDRGSLSEPTQILGAGSLRAGAATHFFMATERRIALHRYGRRRLVLV